MSRARKAESPLPEKPEVLVDSREGIARLVAWAKAGGFVLNLAHAAIAEKHGVSTEGVALSRPLPVAGVDLARGPDRCAVWGGPGLMADALSKLDLSGFPVVRWKVRLKLRLSFRDWSRAVDADGLASVRQWLTVAETALNASRVQSTA